MWRLEHPMSRSLNRVQLLGNLGAEPRINHTRDGKTVANIRLATSERWKTVQGTVQERTEWHHVVLFGKLAEVARDYLKKGSKVFLEGKLQTRKWVDNQEQVKFTTEIVLNGFDSKLFLLDPASGIRPPPQSYLTGHAVGLPPGLPVAQEDPPPWAEASYPMDSAEFADMPF